MSPSKPSEAPALTEDKDSTTQAERNTDAYSPYVQGHESYQIQTRQCRTQIAMLTAGHLNLESACAW